MRKRLMIALFAVSVSLITQLSLAATVANCPIGSQASTNPPPPGWIYSTDPLISSSMAIAKPTISPENYHLIAIIYSQSNTQQYNQKIFCQYQQLENCHFGNCASFTLASQATFKNITPSPTKISSLWQPYNKIENTVIFSTSPDNYSAVTFDNNPG